MSTVERRGRVSFTTSLYASWDDIFYPGPRGRLDGSRGCKYRDRCRFAPHQLRHAHAVEMAREGVPLNIIQRQLGHANLGITSIYLQGIDSGEIVAIVHQRPAPVMPASAGLRLA